MLINHSKFTAKHKKAKPNKSVKYNISPLEFHKQKKNALPTNYFWKLGNFLTFIIKYNCFFFFLTIWTGASFRGSTITLCEEIYFLKDDVWVTLKTSGHLKREMLLKQRLRRIKTKQIYLYTYTFMCIYYIYAERKRTTLRLRTSILSKTSDSHICRFFWPKSYLSVCLCVFCLKSRKIDRIWNILVKPMRVSGASHYPFTSHHCTNQLLFLQYSSLTRLLLSSWVPPTLHYNHQILLSANCLMFLSPTQPLLYHQPFTSLREGGDFKDYKNKNKKCFKTFLLL